MDDKDETDGNYEDRLRSIELLNETHEFPCPVMIKVIGNNEDDFISRIVKVIRDQLHLKFDPPIRTREAKNGKHISVTIEPRFLQAEEVIDLYAKITKIDGVVMVL